MKKIISLVTCVTLLFCNIGFYSTSTVYASTIAYDAEGHWAYNTITEFIELGYMKGYSDGSFKPNKSITRAEFVTLANNVFGYTLLPESEDSFTDVSDTAWYSNAVNIAKSAGYISGYTDGNFRPNENITRQEVCVVLSIINELDTSDNSGISSFSDGDEISSWAKGYVSAAANSGYINGYPDGSFKPDKAITRAEAVTVLSNLVEDKRYAYDHIEVVAVYSEAGTYGPEGDMEQVEGNVYINGADITLQNTYVMGDLILGENIGDGDATLDNVYVSGDTIIQGGGENSITIKNSNLENLLIVRVDGIVRVIAVGNTTMEDVSVAGAGAILREYSLTSDGFENVEVLGSIQEGAEFVIEADIESLVVDAPVEIDVTEGSSVGELTISDEAEGSSVNITATSSVNEITFEGSATVSGSGQIDEVTINCDGVEVEQEVSTINIDDGVSEGASVGGETVIESTAPAPVIVVAPSSSSSSSSSSGSSSNSDTSSPTVSIDPEDGTTGVAIEIGITISFNEAIRNLDDSALLGTSLAGIITLKEADENGNNITYSGIVADNQKSITITPSSIFSYNQDYYIGVNAQLEDDADNVISTTSAIFTTLIEDVTPPAFTISPANGTTGVAIDSSIQIDFDEPVRNLDDSPLLGTSLSGIVVLKETDENGSSITYSGIVADDYMSIMITPASVLSLNQDYYVGVNAQLEDDWDNVIVPTAASFQTETDDAAPVVSISPSHGAINVPTNSAITISFDEPVRNLDDSEVLSTSLASIVVLKESDENGNNVTYSGIVAADKMSITITPSSLLSYSQDYYVEVKGQLEDEWDNGIITTSAIFTAERDPAIKGITFMVYMAGDNNLEPCLIGDVAEMKAGVTDEVNLIILADRIDDTNIYSPLAFDENFDDTRLYEITPNTATRISGGSEFPEITTNSDYEANMGDPEVLQKFIQFGKANYPADKLVLILWNHGGGSKGMSTSSSTGVVATTKEICLDESIDSEGNWDWLYTAEITDTLTADESVDILGFDACLMGSVEVAYQYCGTSDFKADYMIASAPSEWGDGWDYDSFLPRFSSVGGDNGETDLTMGGQELYYDPVTVTSSEIGCVIVEEQRDSTTGSAVSSDYKTSQSLSCYDLSKVAAVKEAVDDMAIDIYYSANVTAQDNFEAIRGGYGNSQNILYYFDDTIESGWKYTPFIDLYDLCEQVSSGGFELDIISSANNVLSAVDEMILWSFGNDEYEGFQEGKNGMSIFFSEGDYIFQDGTLAWAYLWWYNAIDTESGIGSNLLYGKLNWCIDDAIQGDSTVSNWFELLDAWYDTSNGSGGYNRYQW